MLPRLRLTAGTRYEISQNSLGFTTEGYFGSGPPTGFSGAAKGSATTPKIAASFDASPSTMVYASAAEGFRDGGVNRPVPIPLCTADLALFGLTQAPKTYGSDSLWSYELGVKSHALEDSLVVNTALYDIRWSHIQNNIPLPTCTFNFFDNVGSAEIRGVELELRGRFLERLTATLSGNYTSTKIVEPAPLIGVMKGDHVPGVPDYSIAATIEYTQVLVSGVQGFTRANAHWTGSSQGEILHSDPDFYRPPYVVTGASIGFRRSNYEVSLFVKNLLNENEPIQRTYNASVEYGVTVTPRTYGLSGTYSF